MDGDKNNRNKKQKDELHLKKNIYIYYIRFFLDNVKENHFYDKNA